MNLITYLPASRLSDLTDYFKANIELLRPRRAVVYVDNIVDCGLLKQPIEADYVCVNYGNRGETWLDILSNVYVGDVVVDSDVVLDRSFPEVYGKAIGMGAKMIGIADVGDKPGPRDVVVDGVPYTKILVNARGQSPVFFGPKQAVIINHVPIRDYVDVLRDVLSDVPKAIRNCIADETILGLYALMIGQARTPWFPAAYNAGSSSDVCGKKLRAYANYALFKSLIRHGIYVAGLSAWLHAMRYRLSWLL